MISEVANPDPQVETEDSAEKLDEYIVYVPEIELFHGSTKPGITVLHDAEEHTLGKGVYLTAERVAGEEYARIRMQREGSIKPVLYAVKVADVNLLDLRSASAIRAVAGSFAAVLREQL